MVNYIPPGPASWTPAEQLAALQTAERRWAYVLLRLILGVNLFGHGVARILHGTSAFALGMVGQMASTPLPAPAVQIFGYVVPWIELALGTLLILGLFTRSVLTAAMLFMTVLMLGMTLKQDWPTAGTQLVYAAVIIALLFLRKPYDATWPQLLKAERPSR